MAEKKGNPAMARAISKGFGNRHANLMSETSDHPVPEQRKVLQKDRMQAMARRTAKAC